jgi:hypothetical protein
MVEVKCEKCGSSVDYKTCKSRCLNCGQIYKDCSDF